MHNASRWRSAPRFVLIPTKFSPGKPRELGIFGSPRSRKAARQALRYRAGKRQKRRAAVAGWGGAAGSGELTLCFLTEKWWLGRSPYVASPSLRRAELAGPQRVRVGRASARHAVGRSARCRRRCPHSSGRSVASVPRAAGLSPAAARLRPAADPAPLYPGAGVLSPAAGWSLSLPRPQLPGRSLEAAAAASAASAARFPRCPHRLRRPAPGAEEGAGGWGLLWGEGVRVRGCSLGRVPKAGGELVERDRRVSPSRQGGSVLGRWGGAGGRARLAAGRRLGGGREGEEGEKEGRRPPHRAEPGRRVSVRS